MWDLRPCPSARVRSSRWELDPAEKLCKEFLLLLLQRSLEELAFTGLRNLHLLVCCLGSPEPFACWMLKELSCKSAFPIHHPSPNILVDLSSSPHCLMVLWGSSLGWGACMCVCVCFSCFQEWMLACSCFIFPLNHPEFMGSKSARSRRKFS